MEKMEEILNDQVGGGLGKESYELIGREECEIFDIVTTEQGSFVALGQYRLTDFATKEKAIEQVKNRDYDLILSLISLITKKR